MSKIVAFPKYVNPETHKQQVTYLTEQFAAFIAAKLSDLLKLGRPGITRGDLPSFARDTALMSLVGKHCDDPQFAGIGIVVITPNAKKHKSVATRHWIPK